MRPACTIPPPPPILGGARVYCPWNMTERWSYCGWQRRGRTVRVLRAYRRHWLRRHRDGA